MNSANYVTYPALILILFFHDVIKIGLAWRDRSAQLAVGDCVLYRTPDPEPWEEPAVRLVGYKVLEVGNKQYRLETYTTTRDKLLEVSEDADYFNFIDPLERVKCSDIPELLGVYK